MKVYIYLCLIGCFLLLVGCWDRVEIEEMGFVSAVGFDPFEGDEQKFSVTQQIALPGRFNMEPTGKGGGGGDVQAFENITSTGITNFKVVRNLSSKTSRKLSFTHLRVILVHEDLARNGLLDELMDFYSRDHQMRRRSMVFIGTGNMKEILNTPPMLENITAQYIELMEENYPFVLEMPREREIGEVIERTIGKRSYIIPRIMKKNEEIKIGGAAAIRGEDNQMVGWLGENDIRGYNWIMEEGENGVVEVFVDDEEKERFIFELNKMATDKTYKRVNGEDHFNIKIKGEGYLGEYWFHKGRKVQDVNSIKFLEQQLEKQVKKDAEQLITKMQEEFYTDIFDLTQLIKKEDYAYWQNIRDTWSSEGGGFPNARITVETDFEIRHHMLLEDVTR